MINVPRRYSTLRTIAVLYQVMGALLLVISIFSAVALFMMDVSPAMVASMIPAVVGGITGALFFFGTAQAIYVFIDIEENTRRASVLTEMLLNWEQSGSTGAPPPTAVVF